MSIELPRRTSRPAGTSVAKGEPSAGPMAWSGIRPTARSSLVASDEDAAGHVRHGDEVGALRDGDGDGGAPLDLGGRRRGWWR